jgi:hypothetical protein
MDFRIGRDRNVEWSDPLQSTDQFHCIAIAAGMRPILRARLGRVAA